VQFLLQLLRQFELSKARDKPREFRTLFYSLHPLDDPAPRGSPFPLARTQIHFLSPCARLGSRSWRAVRMECFNSETNALSDCKRTSAGERFRGHHTKQLDRASLLLAVGDRLFASE
jgi:hypothetical protein